MVFPLHSKGSHNCRLSCQCQWRVRWRGYRSPFALRSMSCFIGEPPSLCASQRDRGAVNGVHAKLFPVAVAEIEFGQIALKVRFADVLVYAINAAFEDREKAFNRVGGDDSVALVAHVFVFLVLYGSVRSKIPSD